VNRAMSRRAVLKGATGAAALASTSGMLTACGALGQASAKTDGVLRIGYVYPFSGGSSGFGEADGFVMRKVRAVLAKGLTSGGKKYSVEIIDRDSQSEAKHAMRMATELVKQQKVDLMLCTSTPETVNPVADVCEKAGIPCLSTAVPWEAWYFGRGATAAKPFTYTYHFFAGAADISKANASLWQDGKVKNNGRVGVLWPADADGMALRQAMRPLWEKAGLTIVDPGAYQDGTTDYSGLIRKFQKDGIDILTGVPLPADFARFWAESSERNFRPRITTVGKTCELPSQIQALGASGLGISTTFWWTPTYPYPSTLTGRTGQQLVDEYTGRTGRQWTQVMGSSMALFEVAVQVLESVSDPKDRRALAAEIGRTKITTMVGPLDWTKGPVKNVSTHPLVAIQWRQASLSSGFLVEPVIVDNGSFPDVPLGGVLEPLV
jgi:branched-chain amino acid transport system substrate-binding protein